MTDHRIVCAANKYYFSFEGGKEIEELVICGARHYDLVMRKQISVIDEYYWSCKFKEEQGFLDNHGNFLTREDAFIVAERNGQIIRQCGNLNSRQLFSENLY